MKALGKVLGLIFLGLLLLVVALGFALTQLFDPNDYKDEIRQLAKGRGLKLIDAAPGKTALDEILPVIDEVAGKLKGERLESCRGNRGGKGKPVKAPRK